MTMAQRIEQKLTKKFKPVQLIVQDDSARHAGHAGARPGGETHFSIEIVSAAFAGQNAIDRQRAVYVALRDEMEDGIHALALKTLAPGETR